MRVGILGVSGRMGALLVEEAKSAGHQVLGGALNPALAHMPPDGMPVMSLRDLMQAVDVVIDFTHAAAVQGHAEVLAASEVSWVVGTTGLSEMDHSALRSTATKIPVVYAENFGNGLNLLLAFAEQLGAALPAEEYDAEIVEIHHRQKVDAPSGSAVIFGEAVARGRGVRLQDVIESGRDGHTGPRRSGAIGFASMRAGQVIGEHTLLFASAGEHIALTHRALDRRVFASGAIKAAAWTIGKPAGLYSFNDVLGNGLSGSSSRLSKK